MSIVLEHVTKRLGTSTVIDDVSLSLDYGCVYGFQGINGSGKTMLMRLISGLIYPSSGTVAIDGKKMGGQNNFPDSMGLLIETPAFLGAYTGYRNLEMLAAIQGKITGAEIETALIRIGLDPKDSRKYRKYSLGMKQRLGIACAVMEHPKLLILDEPFNSLDEDGIELVERIVMEEKDRGACVILSCHDFEELSNLSNEIFKLVAGKLSRRVEKNAAGSFVEVSI